MTSTIRDHEGSDSGRTITMENYDIAQTTTFCTKSSLISQDHARIVPVNRQAKLAFHEVAHVFRYRPELIPHAGKYMHINEDQSAFTGDAHSRKFWTGYYRLNLDIPPKNLARGWVIGTGHLGSNRAEVDIMISVFGSLDDVRVRHARILYHRSSRVLMLKSLPGRAVFLNGMEIFDEPYTLSVVCMGLTIGNLTYRLEFPQINNQLYHQQLDLLMSSSNYWGRSRFKSFQLIPSNRHYDLGDYQIHSPQAAGAYGVVSACLKKSTGNLYAAKRVQRTKKSFDLVKDELAVLNLISEHPHVCNLVDTLYSDGDRASIGPTSVNDIYMILNPYAPETLEFLKDACAKDILHAFHQAIQGLAHIHSHGVIHRDIKPSNLLVADRYPVRIVIADFGHATTEAASIDHLKGTLTHLPPEILSHKADCNSGGWCTTGIWTPASDVFSLGIVGFELFHHTFPRQNSIINVAKHNVLMTQLRRQSHGIDRLLREMISVRPGDRPTASDILRQRYWVNQGIGSGNQGRKRDSSALEG